MSIPARSCTLRSHLGADRSASSLPTLHFALLDGDPAASGVEPTTAGGYARVAVANDAALWGALAVNAVAASNVVAVTWPALTGLWSQPTLTHWAIYDNATGGTLWYSGQLAAPLVVTGAGDVPRIPVGALTVEV